LGEGEVLRLNRAEKTFVRLPHLSLSETGILERHDIQAMIAKSPQEFFDELGEKLTLLAQEVRPDDVVDDRIDLLAADVDGASVIIELKRGNHKMHLLQALSYAGMLSKLDSDKFIERVASFANKTPAQVEEALEDFVEELGAAAINQSQRVVLIAEDFDYSVLITAEWLSEKYSVDVRCYRLRLASDQAAEFLTCERVYPPAELTEQAIRVRKAPEHAARYKNWDEALSGIDNKAIVEFFRQELAHGRRGYLYRRILNWSQDGHRRFRVIARRNFAYGWQEGRFEGDVEFWRSKLGGDDADVGVVGRYDNRVRFRLRTAEQITAFREAIDGPLKTQPFLNTAIPTDDGEGEGDEQ
jgi:hypothetical protein